MKIVKIVLCFTFCLMMSSCFDFLTNPEFETSETENAHEIKRTFSTKTNISLSTVCGNCIIQTGVGDSIHVRVQHTFNENIYIAEFSVNGNILVLEERFAPGTNATGSSTWTITAPAETHINFISASGDFTASDRTGNINCETASGNMSLDHMQNQMNINSASGRITAENITGAFNLNTASGNITVENLTAENGCSFTSASGNVYVRLAESTEYNLNLSTASSDATLDYNGHPVNGTFKFTAKVNDGNISCPCAFDTETTYWQGNSQYMQKTVVCNITEPHINISTASGTARLIL